MRPPQALPADLLDLGDYGLLETVGFWQAEYPDAEFVLLHDTSKIVQRNRKRWEIVLDPANPAAKVGQDRRTIELPLPVRGLYPQLQVADLVAGRACALMSARTRFKMTEYSQALMDVGLLDAVRGGVRPTSGTTPEQLETESPVLGDAADFIAELHRRAAENAH